MQNTDGKSISKRKGLPNVTQTEARMGAHEGCGGTIWMKMDQPLGSWRCDKCKRVIQGKDTARALRVEKYVGQGS